MGYTHYWTFKKQPDQEAYNKALEDCREIVKATPVPLELQLDESGVFFNGVGENAHETFILSPVPNLDSRTPELRGFNFCKTAQKPYDIVVTACLCVLKARLGDSVSVSSDGDPEEWEEGRLFANEVLGRVFYNPIEKEENDE
jgi:hypothetical protein